MAPAPVWAGWLAMRSDVGPGSPGAQSRATTSAYNAGSDYMLTQEGRRRRYVVGCEWRSQPGVRLDASMSKASLQRMPWSTCGGGETPRHMSATEVRRSTSPSKRALREECEGRRRCLQVISTSVPPEIARNICVGRMRGPSCASRLGEIAPLKWQAERLRGTNQMGARPQFTKRRRHASGRQFLKFPLPSPTRVDSTNRDGSHLYLET